MRQAVSELIFKIKFTGENKMNCIAEKSVVSDAPALAGNLRLLLGLTVLVCGLIFGLVHDGQGQGLGFLMLLISPFILLKDKPRFRQTF